METEQPRLPQDAAGNTLPLPEAIDALIQAEIQALKHVEMISAQLFQVLEKQVDEVENLHGEMKKRRDISKAQKNVYNRQSSWWGGLGGEIREHRKQSEYLRTFLENRLQECREDLAAFKQLQEDIGNLPLK